MKKKIKGSGMVWLLGNLFIPVFPIFCSVMHTLISSDGDMKKVDYLSDMLVVLVSISYSLISLSLNIKNEDKKTNYGVFGVIMLLLSVFLYGRFKASHTKISGVVVSVFTVVFVIICSIFGSKISDETYELQKDEQTQRLSNCYDLLNMITDERYKNVFWKNDNMPCEQKNFSNIKDKIEEIDRKTEKSKGL